MHSKEPYIPSEEPCEVCIGNIHVTYTSAKASRSASHPQSNFFLFSDLHGRALYSIKRTLNVRKRALHYRKSTCTKQVFSDWLGGPSILSKELYISAKEPYISAKASPERYTSTKQFFLFSDLHGRALYSIKRALNVRKRALHYRTFKSKRYTSTKQLFSDWLGKALYLIKRALYIHKRALYIRKRVQHYRKSKSPVLYGVASVSRIDKLQVCFAKEP